MYVCTYELHVCTVCIYTDIVTLLDGLYILSLHSPHPCGGILPFQEGKNRTWYVHIEHFTVLVCECMYVCFNKWRSNRVLIRLELDSLICMYICMYVCSIQICEHHPSVSVGIYIYTLGSSSLF